MKWEKKYRTGVDRIDLEHRVFFSIVSAMEVAITENASKDMLRRLILEVTKYSEFHFLSEENTMINIGYPGFKNHQTEHRELTKKLKKHIINFESGKVDSSDFLDFIRNWLSVHTLDEDLKMSKYIK